MLDAQLNVTVPGGFSLGESIERSVTFKLINGELEQAISSINKNENQPTQVTKILALALEKVGDTKVDREITSRLCVADRQFLMLQLAVLIEGDLLWLQVDCKACSKTFDVELKRSELPIKPRGEGYPCKQISLNGTAIKLRVLDGFDQDRLCRKPEKNILKQVLSYCLQANDGQPLPQSYFDQLSDSDIDTLDSLLDDIAPAICDQLQISCPECGVEQTVDIDLNEVTGIEPIEFYSEIHQLASHYHWSEDAILKLSRNKRRLYLKLISQSRGMVD